MQIIHQKKKKCLNLQTQFNHNEAAAPKDTKTILGEGEKLKKLRKDTDLTTISLISEHFFLYHLKNLICQPYVTKIEKSFSLYGLISFSRKVIKEKAVSLVLPQNKLKFNVEKDILKKKLSFELKKLNEKTPIVTSRDDILNFGISYTKKLKKLGKKEKCRTKFIKDILLLDYRILITTKTLIQ